MARAKKTEEEKVEKVDDVVAEEKKEATKTKAETKVKPVEEEVEEVVEEPKRKKVAKIDPSELIAVRSCTFGKLIYTSRKTGISYIWENKGDEEYLEFGELMTMKASSPKFLKSPYIVIEDEDVIEKLGLTDIYKNITMIEDLDRFFRLPLGEMEEKIEMFPQGFRSTLLTTANKLIKSGQLYDIRKIKLLENKLKVDLETSLD